MDMQYIEFVECLARIADKAVQPNFVDFPVEVEKTKSGARAKKTVEKTVEKATSFWMKSVPQTPVNKDATDEIDS